MKYNRILLLLGSIVFLTSCGSPDATKKQDAPIKKFEVFHDESSESSMKAQWLVYAKYLDTNYSHEALSSVIQSIYSLYENKSGFENHSSPTVVGIYMYTSKDVYLKDKSGWICMLFKGPLDASPGINYNDIKLEVLVGLQDTIKSKDEIAIENLKSLLNSKGLDLCQLKDDLSELNKQCLKRAELKYPEFDFPQYDDYVEKIYSEEKHKLALEIGVPDSVLVNVSWYGYSYCK